MFRKMRRFKQQISDEECIKVLKEAKRGVLSVLGDDGYPYGLPVSHWYNEADGKIYFHGAKSGHKLDAVKACDKVSFCAMDEGYREEGDWALNIKSVITFGRIRFYSYEEEPEKVREVCVGISSKFTEDPDKYADDEIAKVGKNVLIFEITPEHMTGKLVNEA